MGQGRKRVGCLWSERERVREREPNKRGGEGETKQIKNNEPNQTTNQRARVRSTLSVNVRFCTLINNINNKICVYNHANQIVERHQRLKPSMFVIFDHAKCAWFVITVTIYVLCSALFHRFKSIYKRARGLDTFIYGLQGTICLRMHIGWARWFTIECCWWMESSRTDMPTERMEFSSRIMRSGANWPIHNMLYSAGFIMKGDSSGWSDGW